MENQTKTKEAFEKLWAAYREEGVWQLLPLDLLAVGAAFGLAPVGGMIIRKLRADGVKNPRLTRQEKALLKAAVSASPDQTWTDLWLKVNGKKNDLRTSNKFNLRLQSEATEVLKRIGDIFCFLWEYQRFFPKDYPKENAWWCGFLDQWGIAKKPLAYARRLAPEPPPPPLKEVVRVETAKDFHTLCLILYDFFQHRDLVGWRLLPPKRLQEEIDYLASSLQAEVQIAMSHGTMLALLGIPFKADNRAISLFEKNEDQARHWDPAPLQMEQVVLNHRNPRVVLVLSEKGLRPFHDELIALLKEAKASGKIKKLHLVVSPATRDAAWKATPIGVGDEDPELWSYHLTLVSAAQAVETNEKIPQG